MKTGLLHYPGVRRRLLFRWLAFSFALFYWICMPASASASASASVEVRRTTDGIPHIRASSWRGLGYGVGYAQAEDALCTLADGFVTFEGQRSWYFGADKKPPVAATFGRPANLDLDFFFRAFADARAVDAFRNDQPVQIVDLAEGYADGYNRYLASLEHGSAANAPACANDAWVHPITAADVYRRMIAADLAGGYARFVPEIVNARPPGPRLPTPPAGDSLQSRLDATIGGIPGLGSNMLAFGEQATGGNGSVLLGNPHWYWGGIDRLYQAQLTVPGQLNVAGVSFLGIPVVMLGFNDHVAWSETVSEARRFGLFELKLDPADPTRYLVDGRSEPMQPVELAVEVRLPDGTRALERRTLYRTRFGPLIDMREGNAALGWGTASALAIRDVNEANHRVFRNFVQWGMAHSLDEFIAIQRREAALPWVNVAAIGRGDGRAWFSSIGAIPDVPDTLRSACASPLAGFFARLDPFAPMLDGSRAECDWRVEPNAVQAGAMPADSMPALLRTDYVANMNNSHWLINPAQPLTGFPLNLGGEQQPLSLREREGLRIADALLRDGATSAALLAARAQQTVLEARAYSADQYKRALLDSACAQGVVRLAPALDANARPAPGSDTPKTREVNVRRACQVLRDWSNRAGVDDRGALLWGLFWGSVSQIPDAQLFAVPFSVADPLQTPREPRADDPRIPQALAQAVDSFVARGWALDAPVGRYQFAASGDEKIPMPGGREGTGYFAVANGAEGGYEMGPGAEGNSYLQMVYFGGDGVHAATLLAHGERDSALTSAPTGGAASAPIWRYSKRAWLSFPFREAEIMRDPGLRTLSLFY